MHSISKLKSAAGASTYFRDKDDYYLSDAKSAEWWGHGAAGMGLAGGVGASNFRDVLEGKINGVQEFPAGYREVKTKGGKTKKVPAHRPGWDNTFSAPKSVSIAALVHGDTRIIATHDAAVRTAMTALESEIAVTRQRTEGGGYEYRRGTGIAGAMFRHASSRDFDPQLHTHVVIPNVMRDPETGKWVSIDSREGLYKVHREAETLYTNALAAGLRDLGYQVEWHVNSAGFPEIELPEISAEERALFSTRTTAIDAKLAQGGITREQATQAQRQQATLATRSPKKPVPAAQLRHEWRSRLAGLQGPQREFAQPQAGTRADPTAAADAAIAFAAASISERSARFTPRDLMIETRIFSQGRATENELQAAMTRALNDGSLLPADTLARVPGGDLKPVPGFTTQAGQAIECDMLATVDRMHRGGQQIVTAPEPTKAAVEAADDASGGRLTDEHKVAIRGILADDSRIQSIQGLAGSAKTTGVLANVANAARRAGWNVEALAPTVSAAGTLGKAIGAKGSTVASFNLGAGKPDDHTLMIVDEAGLIGAADMQKLLQRADEAGAKLVLVGDTKQIGSVQAGRAFDQIQATDPQHTYTLTKIFRQRNEALKQAVKAAARGDVLAAFAGVEVSEHRSHGTTDKDRAAARAEAVQDVADRYMGVTAKGKETLAIALGTADRDAINAAIQDARVKAGQVSDVRDMDVLRPKGWTREQQADAARFAVGDVIKAHKDVAHLSKGGTAEVIGVSGGKVTVRNRDGVDKGQEWTFDPAHYKSFTAYDAEHINVGVGDKLAMRGKVAAQGSKGNWRTFANGDTVTVTGRGADGGLQIKDTKGSEYSIAPGGLQADLGYAQTADSAQGKTVDDVIGYVRSNQTNLATQQRLYVLASRARDSATLITDDAKLLAERIQQRPGRKEAALADDRVVPENARDLELGRRDLTDGAERPHEPQHQSFIREATPTTGAAGREVAAGRVQALHDHIGRLLHQGEATRITAAQAAVAAKLALQEHENNDAKLLPRRPPSQDDWRRMTACHGVAVAPDGTRFTQDGKGKVYSDRQLRAERREITRSEWIDPRQRTQFRIVGEKGSTHAIAPHDHGKTWHRADLFDSLSTRYKTWRRDRIQARLELDRLKWQAAGGKETHDNEWLARESIKSFQRREKALFKGRFDWDELAARNGVAYDRDGHRYTMDNRGRVWSEALAKRGWAVERTRAGREAMWDMRQHANRGAELARDRASDGTRRHHLLGRATHAVGCHMVRARLEKVIGDGQQRELDRLANLALDGSDRRWRDAGRHESRDSREVAREALQNQHKGNFDWDKAALERGVLYDREGRRYATDDRGMARSEALEKTAYHFRYNANAREAKRQQDHGSHGGPLAWWSEQRTREAMSSGVEQERSRLGRLAGGPEWEHTRQPESAPVPTRTPAPDYNPQRDAGRGR